MPNTFEVNQQANIADLGTCVNEALFHLEDNNADSVRDRLLEAHNIIYPNATRTATPEENARICAGEKTAPPLSKIEAVIDGIAELEDLLERIDEATSEAQAADQPLWQAVCSIRDALDMLKDRAGLVDNGLQDAA